MSELIQTTETQKTIVKIGDLFDTGWKIIGAIVGVVAFIVNVALAWYQIKDNAAEISTLEKKMETGFINEADKRTTRISTTDVKFDKVDGTTKELAKQIDELQREVFYMKGLLSNKK